MEEIVDVVVVTGAAVAGIAALTAAFGGMRAAGTAAGAGIDRVFDTMATGLNRLQGAFFSLRAVILAFGGVLGVFKTLTENLTKFQAFISAMSVSVGGVKEARVEFSFLMEMADRLGISIKTLQHNYAQMSAAALGSTLTTDKLRIVFESFSVAARVMHLSTIDTRLMFYALTQMVSKGTVSMEELRRQLGEKLPGAMNIAARSVNAGMKEFEEAVRKGTVDSAKFLPIFAAEVKRSFGPGLALAASALDAELNRLNNSLQRMIIQMYDAGVATAFTQVIKELIRILADPKIGDVLSDTLKTLATQFKDFLEQITPGKMQSAVTTFSTAMKAIGKSITEDLLPFLMKAGEYFGLLVRGWFVLKGITAGAAVGALVGQPVAGAVVGGIAAYTTQDRLTQNLKNIANSSNLNKSGKIRPMYDPYGPPPPGSPQPWDVPPDVFAPAMSSAKLTDVLNKSKDKKAKAEKASPFMAFLESLKQRDMTQDEDTNKYDALREKAISLIKKEPGKEPLLEDAIQLIDSMEERGVEFKPLIDRISGLLATIDKDLPGEIDRRVEEQISKYPLAKEAAARTRGLATQYRKQYEDEQAKQQGLFEAKQDEIIRKMQMEGTLLDEQVDLVRLTNDERDKVLKKLDLEKKLEEEIVQLRAEAIRSKRTFDETSFRDRGTQQIDNTLASMDRLQKANRDWYNGLQKAVADYAQSSTDGFAQAQSAFNFSMKGMEDALTEFLSTGKISFRSLADTFIVEINRMVVKAALAKIALDLTGKEGGYGFSWLKAFGLAMGLAGGGGAGPDPGFNPGYTGTAIPGDALGMAYGPNGRLRAFASGAAFTNMIVNKPTYFKFASGMGVMGEAGEEAIMPLGRDNQGRLGVRGQGGGGPVVIVNVYPKDADSFVKSRDQVTGAIWSGLRTRGQRMT